MRPLRVAIVGFGKIAKDQHLPAINASAAFELAAVATRQKDPALGVPWFATSGEMFAAMAGRLDAVAICTPPAARHAIACAAMKAGLHVLLEKPPAATLGEIEDLQREATLQSRSLYAAWHSQHAAGVARAGEALAEARVASLDISWFEDVRKWHPGQEWIWEPGGFGVFDPGINALSIATKILPVPLFVSAARLLVPSNRQAPIAAEISFIGDRLSASMDWRQTGTECWTIRVETGSGKVVELREGGERLFIDGAEQKLEKRGEYPSIYERFAQLIASSQSEVDREPLRIVADAFLVGKREPAEPFE
jgi:D-galactose 1-dehydrogenase